MVDYSQYIDKSFDHQFEAHSDLTWLPWVGANYNHKPSKLLVVGESHYIPEDDKEDTYFTERTWTRTFIAKEGLQLQGLFEKNPNNLIRNLEAAVFGRKLDAEMKEKFWTEVAYYNLVQDLLDSLRSRPSYLQFANGWKIFFRVIQILEPDFCLFCGVEAGKLLDAISRGAEIEGYTCNNYQQHTKVGAAFPRTVSFEKTGIRNKAVFIRHPSKYFSVRKWHSFVRQEIPDALISSFL